MFCFVDLVPSIIYASVELCPFITQVECVPFILLVNSIFPMFHLSTMFISVPFITKVYYRCCSNNHICLLLWLFHLKHKLALITNLLISFVSFCLQQKLAFKIIIFIYHIGLFFVPLIAKLYLQLH